VIFDLNETPEEKRIDTLGVRIRGVEGTDVEIASRWGSANSYQLEVELKNWWRPVRRIEIYLQLLSFCTS